MKQPLKYKFTPLPTAYCLLPAMALILVLATCSPQKTAHENEHDTYTCPMHPQIISDKPGTCPICGMDLVKISELGSANQDIMLNDNQIALANIKTQKAVKKNVGQAVTLTGRFTLDERKNNTISSRASGRVEKLFIKETGERVRKGEPLYVLYSEPLLTLQQEYLLAKEQHETLGTEKRYRIPLESTRRKLLLYGLTETQIDRLNTDSMEPRITFPAPSSGIVTEIKTAEGQYVREGDPLYETNDTQTLWVEAELYPSEAPLVKTGDKITVYTTGDEPGSLETIIQFLSPEYKPNSQITILRAMIENKNSRYKPGQQVEVALAHSSREAVAVPSDAVIRDGKGAHVYVQAGRNNFRPVMVTTGIESSGETEITLGLYEGDTVVTSGAYLLYSELILKRGKDPMTGHSHETK